MASDDTVLAVRLEARIRDFERNLAKANRSATSSFGSIERRAAQLSSRLNQSLAGAARGLAAPLLGAASLQGAKSLIDTATRIQNALKVAGLEGEGLAKVYDQLYASAQKNAAPLESLVTLYSRVSQVQGELGVTSEQIVGFTDNIALSLRVAGTDAASASGALLQLSQALGSGVVRAEEFSSINEAIPTVMQAAAAGIQEAGGSVAKLRRLMLDGKLSSKAYFDGVNAGAVTMQEKVAGAEQTLSSRLVRLQNVLEDAAGRFNKVAGTSDTFGKSIDALAGYIQALDMGQIVSQIDTVIEALANGERAIYNFANAVGKGLKLDKVGEMLTNNSVANSLGLYSVTAVERRMSGSAPDVPKELQDYVARTYGGKEASQPLTIDVKPAKPKVQPITLADYAVPSTGGSGKGGGRGRKGGGSTRTDDYAREIEQIKERTAATLAETAAMAGLNPLVDDYGYALEKARARQDLLTAAQKAGKAITPELSKEIDTLADTYAKATVEAEKLQQQHEDARDRVQEFNSVAKDTLGGFIQDLRGGVKGAEALSNAIGRIGDAFLNSGLEALFSSKSGQSGGLFGSIFSSLLGGLGGGFKPTPNGFAKTLGLPGFASGTANTGGRTGQVRGLVHGNEAVIPLPNGGKVPVSLTIPNLSNIGRQGEQQRVKVEVAADVDRSGNLIPLITQVADERAGSAVAQGQKQAQRTFPAMQADRARRYS
ncbi:tape measure protein [Tianweitania sp. BSSL-BM11]|uniref:Tape measure protein n=1 Tax=Tianweitania aestuarii TaxID=2814886 RepID=A0ABS5RT35_9HYPH|nr:tape measure protein [Tianweitania aestuarii]MBS9720233.1 tape measure protein [Tianweitania aestuarii]